MHSALFVCNAIFSHWTLVYEATLAQETRLAGQKAEWWELMQQRFQNSKVWSQLSARVV